MNILGVVLIFIGMIIAWASFFKGALALYDDSKSLELTTGYIGLATFLMVFGIFIMFTGSLIAGL